MCWTWRSCNFLLLILWQPDENLSYKGCWVSYQLLTILLYSGCSKPLDNSQLCVWLSREGDMKWLIQKQQRKIDSASPILKDWRPSFWSCFMCLLYMRNFCHKEKMTEVTEDILAVLLDSLLSESFCLCCPFTITRVGILWSTFIALLRKKKSCLIWHLLTFLESRLLDICNLSQLSCLLQGLVPCGWCAKRSWFHLTGTKAGIYEHIVPESVWLPVGIPSNTWWSRWV